jgi:hypothetical protein
LHGSAIPAHKRKSGDQRAEVARRQSGVELEVSRSGASVRVAHPFESRGSKNPILQFHGADSSWFKDTHRLFAGGSFLRVTVEVEQEPDEDVGEDEQPDREVRIEDGDQRGLSTGAGPEVGLQ